MSLSLSFTLEFSFIWLRYPKESLGYIHNCLEKYLEVSQRRAWDMIPCPILPIHYTFLLPNLQDYAARGWNTDMAAFTKAMKGMRHFFFFGVSLLRATYFLNIWFSFSLVQQTELDSLLHPIYLQLSEGHTMNQEMGHDWSLD